MKKDDIYVSFDRIEYKQSKASLLNSQIDLLNAEKHLQNIKQIKARKAKLKHQLYNLFNELLTSLENLEDSMPDDKIPKSVKNKLETEEKPIIKTPHPQEQTKSPEENQLDQQLQEIQEKLKQLNA